MLEDGATVADSAVALAHLMSGADNGTIQEIFAKPVKLLIEDYASTGVGILLFKIGLEAILKN